MRNLQSLTTFTFACTLIYSTVHSKSTGLTQQARVSCARMGTTYSLTFSLDVQSDNVELVYTVNHADPTDVSAGTFDSNGRGIDGSGTSADPYMFTVSGTGSPPDTPITLDSVSADVRKAYIMAPDVIAVDVMAKSVYQAPFYHFADFAGDKMYRPICNFTQAAVSAVQSTAETTPQSTAETTPQSTAETTLQATQQPTVLPIAQTGQDPLSAWEPDWDDDTSEEDERDRRSVRRDTDHISTEYL